MRESGVRGRESGTEPVVSERMMTCAACSRLFQVNDDVTLPLHFDNPHWQKPDVALVPCAGSYTLSHPHRMLPEGRGFSFIELVPDDTDAAARKQIDEIMQCAAFMRDLAELGREQLAQRIDAPMLVGIVQQTSRARTAALGLIR